MSANEPSTPGTSCASVDRVASYTPPWRIDSDGNAVRSKSRSGCAVSMPSIACATHSSLVPGRAATS